MTSATTASNFASAIGAVNAYLKDGNMFAHGLSRDRVEKTLTKLANELEHNFEGQMNQSDIDLTEQGLSFISSLDDLQYK
jgi:hypothetical protein